MRRHRSCDLLRLFYFKEMSDNLSVMGGLPGQALYRREQGVSTPWKMAN
jgi:hypothetical protein